MSGDLEAVAAAAAADEAPPNSFGYVFRAKEGKREKWRRCGLRTDPSSSSSFPLASAAAAADPFAAAAMQPLILFPSCLSFEFQSCSGGVDDHVGVKVSFSFLAVIIVSCLFFPPLLLYS